MKKLVLLTAALLMLMLPVTALAEGLMIVPDDDFYNENNVECSYCGRQYYAAAPEGELGIYKDPLAPEPTATIKNGTLFTILVTYVNYDADPGLTWGCFDTGKNSGWVKMDEMELKYDSQQFKEDYADAISPYPEYVEMEADHLVLYTYPCSGEVSDERYDLPYGSYTISRNPSYVDSQNRTWIYVGYLNSQGDGWFCYEHFDDANIARTEELLPAQKEEQELIAEEEEEREYLAQQNADKALPDWAVALISAAGCALIAVIVLAIVRRVRK